MFPLQIINDIEALSPTLHGVNTCFINHPSKRKITQSAISWKPVDQKNKVVPRYIFLHLCANFRSKFNIPIATEIWELF